MSNVTDFLKHYFETHRPAAVVDFDTQGDRLFPLDLTAANASLTAVILDDTDRFSAWVVDVMKQNNAKYAIGGYNEHRTMYSRSSHFNIPGEEPRRLHLGTDIWGPAGIPVYTFEAGEVYGLANNNNFGDYGGTVIIRYQLETLTVFGLYGHLSKQSVADLAVGEQLEKGQRIGNFGMPEENGYWPPHLHFQLILDMEGNISDYPGVCRFSERERYLQNCPDPMLILDYNFH